MFKVCKAVLYLTCISIIGIVNTQALEPTGSVDKVTESSASVKPFAPLMNLGFGTPVKYPGCTIKMISTNETCVQKNPSVFTDVAWSPDQSGSYSLQNVALKFKGLRILGDFPLGKNGREVNFSMKRGRLVSIEITKLSAELDASSLTSRLSSYFGKPQNVTRQASEIFVPKARSGGSSAMVTVTTQVWNTGDSILEFECNQGLCTMRGHAKAK